jgi:hypothetical protein
VIIMTVTTHCALSPATVVEGAPLIRWLKATTGDEKPGMCGYQPTATTFDLSDSATAGSILHHIAFAEFKPHVSSTGARKSAEDAYDASEVLPVIMGARRGLIKIVAATVDNGASKINTVRMVVSATAGNLGVCATGAIQTGVRCAIDWPDNDRYTLVWVD